MALNAPQSTTSATAQPQAPRPPQTIVLELAVYERYNRGKQLYTRLTDDGKPQHYKFTIDQARILLSETDEATGRPVWRRPRQVVTPRQAQIVASTPQVFDATSDRVPEPEEDDTQGLGLPARLDDGSDDEISDILAQLPPELPDGEIQQI